MQSILCYGDSNTFGYNPVTGRRLARNERWPGVLEKSLGSAVTIIEEGLNHRTTVWDDPVLPYVNGKEYLLPCLLSHKPVDLVILMLGSNDMKQRLRLSASDIADGIGVLADMVLKSGAGPDGYSPELLLVTPPRFGRLDRYNEMFLGHREKERVLPALYAGVAADHYCHFFNLADHGRCPDVDGLHMELPQHAETGHLLAEVVRDIFAGNMVGIDPVEFRGGVTGGGINMP